MFATDPVKLALGRDYCGIYGEWGRGMEIKGQLFWNEIGFHFEFILRVFGLAGAKARESKAF